MDILNIMNTHLKERELQAQKKLHEIVLKLNHGETLEQLAVEYNIEQSLVKNYLNTKNYRFDLSSNKWIRDNQSSFVEDISLGQLSLVPYQLFNGKSIITMADELSITTNSLKEMLNKYNYKYRWRYISDGSKASIDSEALKIVHLLNTRKYTLQEVAGQLVVEVEKVKEILKTASFKKVWTLESKEKLYTTETTIAGVTIVRDLDTGILEYIISNGEMYFTYNQVSLKLGINPNYYYNLDSNKFVLDKHIIELDRHVGKKIIQAIPTFHSINFSKLYSELGLELLAEISKAKLKPDINLNENFIEEDPKIGVNNVKREDKKELLESGESQQIKNEEVLTKTNSVISQEQRTTNVERDAKRYSSPFVQRELKDHFIQIDELVKKLNNGETLYDISGKFSINRKLRMPIVTNLQKKLEDYGYIYNKENKLWELDDIRKSQESTEDIIKKESHNITPNKISEEKKMQKKGIDITEVVYFLNKENSFTNVEAKFGIKNQDLRLLLKNQGYKYDGFFKLWTKKDRATLIVEITEEINEGVQNYSDLEKRGVNIDALKKVIQAHNESKLEKGNKNKKNNTTNEHTLEDSQKLSEFMEDSSFNYEEIKILRQMISERQNFNEDSNNNEVTDVTFKLEKKMLKNIDNYSDLNRISKSMVVENALNAFFESNK